MLTAASIGCRLGELQMPCKSLIVPEVLPLLVLLNLGGQVLAVEVELSTLILDSISDVVDQGYCLFVCRHY